MSIGIDCSSPRRNLKSVRLAVGLLCGLALGFGVCFGWSVPVPDTIKLPDSLGPLRPGYHLAFGSSTNNIYVASESSDIIVVDGKTFQRIKRINTGTPVGGALLVSKHNRLYCSYPSQGCIGIIDCATNTVIGTIPVGTCPTSLCYSSGSDKLYCGDTVDQTISVVDCATNTVRKVISVGNGLTAMAYDPASSKLYAATEATVLAISCSSDSIIARIDAIKSARGLLVNKRRQKLYVVAGHFYPSSDTELYVVSTKTDSLIHPVGFVGSMDDSLARYLACNENTDCLYAFETYDDWNYILEFDCAGDTYTRYSDGIGGTCVGSACDTFRNRVYFLTGGVSEYFGCLMELDCTAWTFIDWNLVGGHPVLGLDPSRYRVMCAGGTTSGGYYEGTLALYDCKADTTYARGTVPLVGWGGCMYHIPATGKLYYGRSGGVGVIDEQTNRLVRQVFLNTTIGDGDMAYSRTSGQLYLTAYDKGGSGFGVVDASRDSIIKFIKTGDGLLTAFPCWSPVGNKVYSFDHADNTGDRLYIAVVDCSTDSVTRKIDTHDSGRWFEYLDNGRVLCDHTDSLSLIDCETDSVLVDSSLEASAVYAVTHSGDGSKVYLVRPGRLEVRSSRTLSLLATIEWPYFRPGRAATFLRYSDTTKKLYWFVEDSVLAIDAAQDTVVARIAATVRHECACFDHTGRYLFCPASDADTSVSLRVYDTRSDRLAGTYPHVWYAISVMPSPEQHCIYVGCYDVILAFPDAPPGLEETPSGEVRATKFGPTVVKGVLVLGAAEGIQNVEYRAALLDAAGRRVRVLHAGVNDVRALSPGVYFVREEPPAAGRDPSVNKVVIMR